MEIVDVIKYEGDNDTFIWKHPCEDFNTKTQLIVHESQEAIFFMNGQALDSFSAGKYTLETENIPLLRKVINIPTDGVTPFHCEVYFINKVQTMAIKWGTDSKAQYLDPEYHFPLAIGASGEMTLSVNNGRKLLLKLVGTENYLTKDQLVSFFRGILNTRIKTYIAATMKNQKINIFEIDERLEEFSENIKEKLSSDFDDYGITLNKFFVTTIVKPEGDEQYEKFKELHFRQYADIAEAELNQKVDVINQQTEAKKMVIESEAIAQKRRQEGYTYQQERGFDVASKVAENEAVGEFTNMGVGLGTMAGVGASVGGMVGGMMNDAVTSTNSQPNQSLSYCENCGAQLAPGTVFCDKCGQQTSNNTCPSCGFKFERPGKFCPKCGYKREG